MGWSRAGERGVDDGRAARYTFSLSNDHPRERAVWMDQKT